MAKGQYKKVEVATDNGDNPSFGVRARRLLAAVSWPGGLELLSYNDAFCELVLPRHVSRTLKAKPRVLLADEAGRTEGRDERLTTNALWVPKEARWVGLFCSWIGASFRRKGPSYAY